MNSSSPRNNQNNNNKNIQNNNNNNNNNNVNKQVQPTALQNIPPPSNLKSEKPSVTAEYVNFFNFYFILI